MNPEVSMTLDEAVAEVLGLLTGLDLEYRPEHDRYQTVTRAINAALKAAGPAPIMMIVCEFCSVRSDIRSLLFSSLYFSIHYYTLYSNPLDLIYQGGLKHACNEPRLSLVRV